MGSITSERVADGTVSLITMDDGKANALTKEAISDIITLLDDAAADEEVVAAVIAGRDGRFSGGFDLGVMKSGDLSAIVDLVADGGELVKHSYSTGLPVVAACTGHAMAAGALLLLGCDVRVGAAGDYKIGLNEVAIGMVVPDWALTIARERMSKRHLQRSIANARIFSPDEALDAGFLDVVVDPDQVVARAIEEAATFAALDPGAYAGTMRAFRGDTTKTMEGEIAELRAAS